MSEKNETMMGSRVYKISFILDNRLDEGAALEKGNALKQSIAALEGSFISEEAPYLRELAYEMTRVQNNANVRFSQGYFGWIKFEMDAEKVKAFEAPLKRDEQIIRFIIVNTVRENTVFTKRAPVVKMGDLASNDDGVNIDTTKMPSDDGLVPESVAPVADTAKAEVH